MQRSFTLCLGKTLEYQGVVYARTFLKFALKGPELLTMLGILEKFGIHGHNAKLSDASEAFQNKMFAFVRRDLRLLRSYDRSHQDATTLLSTDIMDFFLDDIVCGERFRHHDYPLNQMFGIQSEMPNFMMTLHPVTSGLEARNYIKTPGQIRGQVRPGDGRAGHPRAERHPAAQIRHPPRAG